MNGSEPRILTLIVDKLKFSIKIESKIFVTDEIFL